MSSPFISVIIPLYNKEPIVERSLNSVLSQDYDNFEVVVVNDGSTDRSADIVRAVSDPRLRLIEQKNGGPSAARNTGIREAKGKWLFMIDADDEIMPGALKHLAKLTSEHPGIDMFLGEVVFDSNGKQSINVRYHDGEVNSMLKVHFHGLTMQCSGSTLYGKELCMKYLYNEKIRRYEDLECLFRKYKDSKIYLTSFPVAKVNVSYASASRGRKDIEEDFVGHLSFNGKIFWEKMCLYKLFIEERNHYPKQCKTIYPRLYRRYDLLAYYKFVEIIKRHRTLWRLYANICGLNQFVV